MHTPEQLYELSSKVMERFDELQQLLNLELRRENKFYVGACPIHGGDNKSSFNIYFSGDYLGGNWVCRTHSCQRHFQDGISVLSFIRAILSKKRGWKGPRDRDKIAPFSSVLRFCENFVGKNIQGLEIDWDRIEKNRFCKMFKIKERSVGQSKINRSHVREKLIIPSPYYIERGYSPEILDEYDVGTCTTKGKPFYDRAIFPVYEDNGEYLVGISGRSIYDICDKCGSHHNPALRCPSSEYVGIYTKWRTNFNKSDHLFNYWRAKDEIKRTGSIILVESPGNVLRLEEAGIKNSLAILGKELGEVQRFLINLSGASTIITIMDNDEAGQDGVKAINKKLNKLYHMINYVPKFGDIGEMKVDVVKEEICPILEKT